MRITQLEAINEILTLLGLTEVEDLSTPTRHDVLQASSTLDQEVTKLATVAQYFNFVREVMLNPAGDGTITLDANVYDVELRDTDDQVTIRDGKLFNITDNTDQWVVGESYEADITYFIPFDELPEVVKTYVTARTARRLYLKLNGVTPQYQVLQMEEQQALTAMRRQQAGANDLNMFGHRDMLKIWSGSRRRGW